MTAIDYEPIARRMAEIARTEERDQRARDRYAAAADELLRGAEALPGAFTSSIADHLRRALDDGDRPEAARLAGELAYHLNLEQRLAPADEVRRGVLPAVTRRNTAMQTNDERQTVRSLFSGDLRAATFEYSEDFRESRALANSGATGGTTMPVAFADFVAVYERTFSPVMQYATVIERSTGENFTVPRVTADAGGSLVAEAATIPSADPTLSSVTIVPYKYSVINVFSAELENDNSIGLDQLLARTSGRDLGLKLGTDLTTGNGSSKPKGFVSAANAGATATGTPFFTLSDLYDLWGSLATPYRLNGTWMMSTDAFTKILKFTDTTGQPLLQLGAQSTDGLPTLLGRPVAINPAMAAVGSASKSVAFGDFSAYTVIRVSPAVRVERSSEWKFDTDQIALKTAIRVGGDLPDVDAIHTLVSNNS